MSYRWYGNSYWHGSLWIPYEELYGRRFRRSCKWYYIPYIWLKEMYGSRKEIHPLGWKEKRVCKPDRSCKTWCGNVYFLLQDRCTSDLPWDIFCTYGIKPGRLHAGIHGCYRDRSGRRYSIQPDGLWDYRHFLWQGIYRIHPGYRPDTIWYRCVCFQTDLCIRYGLQEMCNGIKTPYSGLCSIHVKSWCDGSFQDCVRRSGKRVSWKASWSIRTPSGRWG